MKLLVGHLQVTETPRGYKVSALGPEHYTQKDYDMWYVRRFRDTQKYFRRVDQALNWAKKKSPITNSEIEVIMEDFNTHIEGLGVESIRDPKQWETYWMETRALYVNMGDTYITTLLYDCLLGKFRTTCWGDFVEKYDKKGVW